MIGKSGIGKSECALDLIERGHRLVADDIVEINEIPEMLQFLAARNAFFERIGVDFDFDVQLGRFDHRPGFLNLRLNPGVWQGVIAQVLQSGLAFLPIRGDASPIW